MLLSSSVQLTFLFFPTGVEQFDSDVFGQFVLGDGLPTVGTFGGCDCTGAGDTW